MKALTKILIISMLFLGSCLSVDTECCDFVDSYQISDSLYVEKYRTFCGGVFGEMIQYYLTDSTNFRIKIGNKDGHMKFRVEIDSLQNIVNSYGLTSEIITDTLNHKKILLSELTSTQSIDTNCLKAIPLFGMNLLKCNNYKYFSSYECEDGYYILTDQFKCNNDYLNAVYLTDKNKFKVLLGFYKPGYGPHYTAELNSENEFDLYETDSHFEYDTVYRHSFKLDSLNMITDLKNVCDKEKHALTKNIVHLADSDKGEDNSDK